jgi:hypothetical protein
MNQRTKTIAGTLSLCVLSLVALDQSALADWAAHHPRRAEVNHRLANQDRRINRERREGELSVGQARQLHNEDRFVRKQERFMAAQNHGHITASQQRSLNQEENGVSRQIGQ